VEVETVRLYAEAGVPLLWPDVHLPHGWHLNTRRSRLRTCLSTGDPTPS
jgi:hypothetical protein